ncbi:Uncharacterised protein [Bordetella pertussis]|nr:Uncharacterised protein [Bordetella pertussis]
MRIVNVGLACWLQALPNAPKTLRAVIDWAGSPVRYRRSGRESQAVLAVQNPTPARNYRCTSRRRIILKYC